MFTKAAFLSALVLIAGCGGQDMRDPCPTLLPASGSVTACCIFIPKANAANGNVLFYPYSGRFTVVAGAPLNRVDNECLSFGTGTYANPARPSCTFTTNNGVLTGETDSDSSACTGQN